MSALTAMRRAARTPRVCATSAASLLAPMEKATRSVRCLATALANTGSHVGPVRRSVAVYSASRLNTGEPGVTCRIGRSSKSRTLAAKSTRDRRTAVTRHGPICFESNGKRYALRWSAFEPVNGELDSLYLLNRARNWSDFTGALSKYGGPTQNFVFVDVDGNIGYYGAGRIPIRRSGDGSVPYDGATDAGEWTGFSAHIRRYRRRRLSIYVLSNSAAIDPKRTVASAARAFW